MTDSSRRLVSTIRSSGALVLSLESEARPKPGADEVLIRVEATPINPSDVGVIFAGADVSVAMNEGETLTMPVSPAAMKALAKRVDVAVFPGNEGAGTVIETGDAPGAKALAGKRVAVLAGAGMYAEHRVVPADQCLILPDDATAVQGASSFVNPLTALGMTETMRREGHKALVHTAAASALGQMLVRLCTKDGIPLVNIVRKPEQKKLLLDLGAKWVCDSSAEDFQESLVTACFESGATIAFDATGGGKLAGRILGAMEAALNKSTTTYARYGSTTHKQVYLYGGLDTSPTELTRNFGMAWGIGGWLVWPFMAKVGPGRANELKQRVASELKTVFATSYSKTITLDAMLDPETAKHFARAVTGEKYVVTPSGQ